MLWPSSWEVHLGKQVAEPKCGDSHSPLSCSSRVINSFTSEHSFEPVSLLCREKNTMEGKQTSGAVESFYLRC